MAWLDWKVASAPHKGADANGDAFVVREVPQGTLVAVLDGLGHGVEAAAAATTATAFLGEAADTSMIPLMRRCHERLRETRGVVMSMAMVETNTDRLKWIGVGNVAGHVIRADPSARPPREVMLTRGGTLGMQLPMLMASQTELFPGDLLILATDGLAPGLGELPINAPLQDLADDLLATYGRDSDDALVLVCRYMSGERRS